MQPIPAPAEAQAIEAHPVEGQSEHRSTPLTPSVSAQLEERPLADRSATAEPTRQESSEGSLPQEAARSESVEGGWSQERGEDSAQVGRDVSSTRTASNTDTDTQGVHDIARGIAGFALPKADSQGGDADKGLQPVEAGSPTTPQDGTTGPAPQAQLDSPSSGQPTSVSASPLSTPAPPALPDRSNLVEEPEEEWLLKSIAWPPLPPRPTSNSNAQGFETSELRVKIIQQNRNGPCSLIALCNVLILRNDLHIPPGRDRVTYSYLSTLLADYFLRITSTPSAPASPALAQPTAAFQSNTRQLSLEAVLSVLPQTRYGLNLNPQFLRIDGYTTSPISGQGELALFSLAQIPLLHGWIADPSDEETYEVLREAKDYDRAVEMMVEGSEVAGKLGLEGQGGMDLSEEELLKEAERRSQWTPVEEEKVRKAQLIDRFLNAASTQLTYPGLFALSSTPSLLPPSGLAALFRNSHLSVIYRRPRTPTPYSTPAQSSPGPELFTLVTDSSFAGEEEVVWESIEDVDGSASEFFTAGLARSHARGGDFAGVRNVRDLPEGAQSGIREGNELADLALAQQLQAEEEHRAEVYERAEQRRYEEAVQARNASTATSPANSPRPHQGTASTAGGRGDGGRHKEGKLAKSKAEKDKCLVM